MERQSNHKISVAMKDTNEILNEILRSIGKVDFKKSKESELSSKVASELSEEEMRRLIDAAAITPDEIIVRGIEEIQEKAESLGYGFLTSKGKEIHAYNTRHWEKVDAEDLEHFLTDAFVKMGRDKYKTLTPESAQRFYRQAQFSYYSHIPKRKDEVRINASNLTAAITFDGVKTYDHAKEDYFFYSLPFPYLPDAECPLWQKFLDEVLPDKEVKMVFQEFYGVCLAPKIKPEKALVCIGTGSNGKSVASSVLSYVLGTENITHFGINGLCEDKSTTRIMLQNKLLNSASEFSGKIWDNGFFKQLVSGEPIEARRLYQDPIIIQDYAKLAFNTNRIPESRDTSGGFMRRLLIVEFGVKISPEKADPELAEKLKAEASGILNWCIEGLQRFLVNGKKFSKAEAIERVVSELAEDIDSLSQFITEKAYRPSAKGKKTLAAVYSEYREFCSDMGEKPISKSDMRRRLEDLGYAVESKGHSGYVVWIETDIPVMSYPIPKP